MSVILSVAIVVVVNVGSGVYVCDEKGVSVKVAVMDGFTINVSVGVSVSVGEVV